MTEPARTSLRQKLRWRLRQLRYRAHELGVADHPDRRRALASSRHLDDLLKLNAETSLLGDEDVQTLSITTVEYFTPSTVAKLYRAIHRLGLNEDFYRDQRPQRWISEFRSREGQTGWYNLGYIVPPKTRYIYARAVRGPVPADFEHIDVHVHALSPSLTACTLTFGLRPERRGDIRTELARYRFLEFRSFKRAYSVLEPRSLKQEGVDRVRLQRRKAIADWMKTHFPGHFAEESEDLRPCLELTLLTDRPSNDRRRPVWELAGLNRFYGLWRREMAGGGLLGLNARGDLEDVAHALLFLNTREITEDVLYGYGREPSDIRFRIQEELSEVVLTWGLQYLLNGMRARLSHTRDNQLGLGRLNAADAVRKLQRMTIENADVQLIGGELQSDLGSSRRRDRYLYQGEDWATKSARDDLLGFFWKRAAKSARRLIRLDAEVRALAQQQGALMVTAETLKVQDRVRWLTVITALLALIAAYPPAKELWPFAVDAWKALVAMLQNWRG